MERLSYKVLQEQGYDGYLLPQGPEKVLQFGSGNFLRGFADYFIDVANEKADFNGKIVVVQSVTPGTAEKINAQDGLYTLYLRGFAEGERVEEKRLISAISRCINPCEDYASFLACARNRDLRYIISNTTEAGIFFDRTARADQTPPDSFPVRLTQLLLERWKTFGGEAGTGWVILSCELIDHNGAQLRRCVLEHTEQWGLPQAFRTWVETENLFCSTLVDRIVTGYPHKEAAALNEENGWEDLLLDTGEIFALWVIEGPARLAEELPFAKAGLPVQVVDDHTPYKKRKVRILNGAHTSMVPAAYLSGENIVRGCMEDDTIRGFMNKALYEEIIPTIDMDRTELEAFARSVADRFNNPFIDHALLSIALNSTSKWRARVLPSVKGYASRFGTLPRCLTLSMAALIALYRCERLEAEGMVCRRGAEEYLIRDDRFVLEFFAAHREDDPRTLAQAVLSHEQMWGEDLTKLSGFAQAVAADLDAIARKGMKAVLREALQGGME